MNLWWKSFSYFKLFFSTETISYFFKYMFVLATQFYKIDHAHASSNSLVKEAHEYCFARKVGVILHSMSVDNIFMCWRSSLPINMLIIDVTLIF